MSTNFDPTKAVGSGSSLPAKKAPKSERLVMVIDSFETPSNAPHFAVGHRFDNPNETLRVRLTTIKERLEDSPKLTEEKVAAQYKSGDNTRDSIEMKAKAGIKLISFDDARLIAEESGVATYRAHWPTTISTSPEAEIKHGLGHIRLREANHGGVEGSQSQAYIELLQNAAVVDKDNIDKVLMAALSITDDQGRAREPFFIMRPSLNGQVLQQALIRIYPGTAPDQVFDQDDGNFKTINKKVDAGVTIDQLMTGGFGKNDIGVQSHDIARALISGIKGLPEPVLSSKDPKVREDIRNLYYGAAEGHLKVDVISAEKINFGQDTRKTYLQKIDRPQFKAYTVCESLAHDRVKRSSGFAPTVVGILRHPDGLPFAVYASPIDMYPKSKKVVDLSPDAINQAILMADKSVDKAVEHAQEPVDPMLLSDEASSDADEEIVFGSP